ncbi:MAG TPA: 3-isopropylmalate dehydratase [Gemmatimonadaceae bacterium]|nr:3-isopropylmalate dehydratase [Gemmatimonadaceae bacterium]
MIIDGRARVLGDDVNTDYIISSRRKRETIDATALAAFLLEGVDPAFAASVRPGDVIVAGRNFGCGSAMEVAATVILAAGIRAVVASSFARSFHRNAINNGLLVLVADTSGVREGAPVRMVVADDDARFEDVAGGVVRPAAPLPPIMRDILAAGGLVGYLKANGRFCEHPPREAPCRP